MTLTLQGDAELAGKLSGLKRTGARAAARKGCRKAGQRIAQAYKRAIPKVSGETVRGVKVRAIKKSRNKVGVSVSVRATKPKSRTDPTPIPYPAATELGSGKIAAKEYEHRAVKDEAADALRVAGEETAKEIEKQAAKAGAR